MGRPTNEYGLTVRQEAFIQAYVLNGGNGTEAARDAGYGETSCAARAYENLRLPHVQVRMETLCRELMGKHAPACIQSLAKLAVSASSETVRQAAANSILDKTGYRSPLLLEISDNRSQSDVDKELAVLLGLDSLDVPDDQAEGNTKPLVKH